MLASLTGEERARAGRFLKLPDGVRWARARGVLRSLLGAYLDASPRTLVFTTGERGKPRLAGRPGRRPLCFNLSHSGTLALFAFARDAVGVDVEVDRRPIDETALAARAFEPRTARTIAELDPRERRLAFLRAWARHEAVLKCRGADILDVRQARAPCEGAGHARPDDPWVGELAVEMSAGAALASAAAPRRLRCWTWAPMM